VTALSAPTADDIDFNLVTNVQQAGTGGYIHRLPVSKLVATHSLPSDACLVGEVKGMKELGSLGQILDFDEKVRLLVAWVCRCIQHWRDGKPYMYLSICRVDVPYSHGGSLSDGGTAVLRTAIPDPCALVTEQGRRQSTTCIGRYRTPDNN
jgi:hypothetical protein